MWLFCLHTSILNSTFAGMFIGRESKVQDWLSVFLKIKSREDAAKVVNHIAYILYFLTSLVAFMMFLAAIAMGVRLDAVAWLIAWGALIVIFHVFRSKLAAAAMVGVSLMCFLLNLYNLMGRKWNAEEWAWVLGMYGLVVLITIRALQAAFAFHKFSSSR